MKAATGSARFDEELRFHELLHFGDGLPGVFRRRMEQLETAQRAMGAYFEGAAIMLQIRGATDYVYLPEDPDDAADYVWQADRTALLNLLAECFERLDCPHLMEQVTGGQAYRRRKVPTGVRLMLAGRDRNGVLNITATCLDRLLVIPNLDEQERSRYGSAPRKRGRWWRAGWAWRWRRRRMWRRG